MTPILYIVVPCYNEQEVLPLSNPVLMGLVGELAKKVEIRKESRVLYVNDGSADQTWTLIEQYHEASPYVGGVRLAGNKGHQNALMAGLTVACQKADVMVTIDADLQDDVNAIREMLMKYKCGGGGYSLWRQEGSENRYLVQAQHRASLLPTDAQPRREKRL